MNSLGRTYESPVWPLFLLLTPKFWPACFPFTADTWGVPVKLRQTAPGCCFFFLFLFFSLMQLLLTQVNDPKGF